MGWRGIENIGSKAFTCGWCGSMVASAVGFRQERSPPKIYICPHCSRPTFLDGDIQSPGVSPGNDVGHLPHDVAALYRESRDCCAASCFTASVLLCRKLLMNIAVAQGAKAGESFVSYVEHLASNGYVPPNGKGWVDHIRKKGNEATHEIHLMSKDEAEELLAFAEMLLKFVYEFPSRVPKAPG